jgi:hypothetical protein
MGKARIASKPDSARRMQKAATRHPPMRETASSSNPDPRTRLAVQFIPAGAHVLELGADRSLKPLLPPGCALQSRPLKRDVSADGADVVVALRALDDARDRDAVFAQLAKAGCPLIVAYRPRDLAPESQERGNDRLGFYDLARLVDRHGYRIDQQAPLADDEVLLRVVPAPDTLPPLPSQVAVVTGGDDFGNRLGLRLVQSLLPPHADLHHLTFDALGDARDHYDLIVVGNGTALCQPLIAPQTLRLLDRAGKAIGLFGTCYRELIPRAALDRLLDRLDTWYAPHQEDLLTFDRGRCSAVHLGNALIDLLPLGQAEAEEPLELTRAGLLSLPLDQSIEALRRHRQVTASDAAALLCALTTADVAAYTADEGSGACRSLLIDVFGRGYVEREAFVIDRDPVLRYKTMVRANLAVLRGRIEALLRETAAARAA